MLPQWKRWSETLKGNQLSILRWAALYLLRLLGADSALVFKQFTDGVDLEGKETKRRV